jgi:polyphosphate kinase
MCLVVRREQDGLKRYVHLGTGNYNPETARIYTDFGYLTCDEELAADVSDLFNALTGYSQKESYRKILVAPGGLRLGILERIEREIELHRESGGGYLAFKLNSLVDKASIQALFRASQAGVRVDLQIRGICGLRPGLKGVSENIRVTSVVGRFLEHTRLFYFRNGGDEEEVFLGSADLMPRNLDGRVEILFPVVDPEIKRSLVDVLRVHLSDNIRARQLSSDGKYRRREPAKGEEPIDSQQWMIEHRSSWHGEE